MKAVNGVPEKLYRYQHILNHMVLFVKLSDCFSLCQLQQRDLRRNHPTKQPAEDRIIAKWDDILKEKSPTNPVGKCFKACESVRTDNLSYHTQNYCKYQTQSSSYEMCFSCSIYHFYLLVMFLFWKLKLQQLLYCTFFRLQCCPLTDLVYT